MAVIIKTVVFWAGILYNVKRVQRRRKGQGGNGLESECFGIVNEGSGVRRCV